MKEIVAVVFRLGLLCNALLFVKSTQCTRVGAKFKMEINACAET